MSRESDSSSSGPQGRGGAAYPSGTPPYGNASGADAVTGAAASGGKPGEPKTETTLTTRIRINIPGSRPIPPVVMRTPVEEADAQTPAAPAAQPPAEPAAPRKERKEGLPTRPKPTPQAAPAAQDSRASSDKTSDWFAPRKSSPARGADRPGGDPGATGAVPPLPVRGARPKGGGARGGARGADRPAGAPGGAPWQGGGPATGAMPQAPLPGDPSTTAATPWPGDPSTTGAMPRPPMPGDPSTTAATPWPGDAGAGAMAGDPSTTAATPWPGDPSTTGAMPRPPMPGDPSTTAATPWPGDAGAGAMAGDPSTTGATPWQSGNATATGNAPQQGQWTRVESTQQFPAPGAGGRTDTPHAGFPAVGGPGKGAVPGGRADTPAAGFPAVQPQAAPAAPAQGKGKKKRGPKAPAQAAGQVSGETLVSGVPPVPAAAGQGARKAPVDSGAPRVPVPKPKPAGPAVPPPVPAPAAPQAESKGKGKAKGKSQAKAAPKKKGRSKLVLVGGALVGLVGLAYGAGLLLDHADVPNGTTVLGVDIGGKSKEAAVQALDSALGNRATAPLKVTVGGKTADLKPAVAGLSIDTQATVRNAAGRDYNPLTVIGSLVGRTHEAEPAVIADEEKIAAALKTVSGETGASGDGTIKFEPGKAVAVYGKAHEGIDVDQAVKAVSKAYRDRAATGKDEPVALPSSGQQPKVSNAEVDRMMKSFAEPAMSGLVTVQTDAAHKIQFGPERSLPKILSVKEVDGKLVENYDLDALKELYGSAFNGVLIQRGDGTKKPVTPQDVAGALGKALRSKNPAERVGVIPLS